MCFFFSVRNTYHVQYVTVSVEGIVLLMPSILGLGKEAVQMGFVGDDDRDVARCG